MRGARMILAIKFKKKITTKKRRGPDWEKKDGVFSSSDIFIFLNAHPFPTNSRWYLALLPYSEERTPPGLLKGLSPSCQEVEELQYLKPEVS
jgi:hypothetical protein